MSNIINDNIQSPIIEGKKVEYIDYKGIIWEYSGRNKPDKLLHIKEIICKKVELVNPFTLDCFSYYITRSEGAGLLSLIQEHNNEIYVWRPTFDDLFYPLLRNHVTNLEILQRINSAIKNCDESFDVMQLISEYSFYEEYEGSYWFLHRGFKCDGPRGVIPAYALYALIYHIMLRENKLYAYGDGSERVVKAFEDFISVYITKTITFQQWLDTHRPKREFEPQVPPYIILT
ncbi:MAG TPA: hypothetical protein VEF53_20010 [Patescibacteria group bacterium]|nr:hypothetical protein [Patescibacteria group bacterium]